MVALSGGADSVCLLHVLLELKEEMGVTLCAAHLDHMLRGEEGGKEARFARSLAESCGVPCVTGSADVGAHARKHKKLSIQQAAREVRYAFLKEKASEQKADKIALGHNANDQAETILMNILRGAGAEGLSGIPPVRDGIYVRPLLELERREIEGYLKARGIKYLDDPSNLKTEYLRNRVRHDLIPLLEGQYNPRLVERLSAMGDIMREERRAVEEWVESSISDLSVLCSPGRLEVNIDSLAAIPLGFRRRAVRRLLRRMGAGPASMDSSKLASIECLLTYRRSGSSLHLGGDLKVMVEFNRLVLCRGISEEKKELCVELRVPGITPLPGRGVRVAAETDPIRPLGHPHDPGTMAHMDLSRLSGPLVVRSRRPGDRFSPLGMAGSKKLKDYLIELRIPVSKRDDVLIVADEAGIVWVVGGRISERVRVTPETSHVLKLRVENIG